MSRYDDFNNAQRKRGSSVFWIFTGILIVAFFFFPFFGSGWRSQVSFITNFVINIAGQAVLFFGVILLGWGLLKLFFARGGFGALKPMIMGFLLLVLGAYLVGIDLIPFIQTGRKADQGYY